MEIEEVRIKKLELEMKIKDLAQGFTQETGATLTGIHFETLDVTRLSDRYRRQEFAVSAEVKI